ncbi:MAG: VOC family protein [Candidatus Sericytochromatia bacterium]
MFLGLRTLGLHVPDLEKAKEWYREVLGYGPYFDEPFYVGFDVGGYELGLVPEEGPVTRGDSTTCYWGVADIEVTHARLVKLGAEALGPIADVGGGILTATVKDPFGNVFGIIFNPHFKLKDEK